MYKSKIRNKKDRVDKQQKKMEFIMMEGYEYGFIQQLMGNGRCKIYCEDGVERMGRIRGSMRKYRAKMIIENHDLVVVTPRDYEPDKVDVIHKFSHEESSHLLYERDLPEKIIKIMERSQNLIACNNTSDLDHIVFEHTKKSGHKNSDTASESSESTSESIDLDDI